MLKVRGEEDVPAMRMPESWNGTISALRGRNAPPARTTAGSRPAPRHGSAPPTGGERAGGADDAAGHVAGHVAGGTTRNWREMSVPRVHGRRRGGVRLTGRGGLLVVFTVCFTGTLIATETHFGVLTGMCYVAACVFTACVVRRTQLLPVVVTPPMLFGAALVCVEVITAHGGVLSVAGQTLITLGGAAPWLFAGTVLGTVAALARGLAGNVQTLRQGLR